MFCEMCGAPARDSSHGVYTCVDCDPSIDAAPRFDPLTGYRRSEGLAWYNVEDMLAGYGN